MQSIEYCGYTVSCYGDLQDDSNISVVCDDEMDDTIWTDGNLDTDAPFKTWEEAVDYLSGLGWSRIEELTAC